MSVASPDTDQFFDYELMLGGVSLSRDTPSTDIKTKTRVISVCDDDDMKTTVATANNSVDNTPYSKPKTQGH